MLLLHLAVLLASFGAIASHAGEGRYESIGIGPVNSWWLDTPGGGLIVVDAQRDAKSAAAAIAAIKAVGRPVRAILVTHPHPDHVAGLATFMAAFPDAAVVAQAATAAELRADTQKLLTLGGAPLPPQPTRIVADGPITIDGLTIEARTLGAGESVAQTVYWLPAQNILFGADLATPTLIPFLAEGRTKAWLAQLAELKRRYPPDARLLPGHGPEAPLAATVDRQTAYLVAYREAVAAAQQSASDRGRTVTPAEIAAADTALRQRFATRGQVAGLPPEKLSAMNAAAVAKELSS